MGRRIGRSFQIEAEYIKAREGLRTCWVLRMATMFGHRVLGVGWEPTLP